MGGNLPAKRIRPVPTSRAVAQTDNSAGGHIAGRDVYEVAGDFVQHGVSTDRLTALGRLYKKLKDDVDSDPALTEYISQLKIFTRTVENEHVVGLDGKLWAAGRQDQLDMAKAMKEMVYGQIRQNMFSRTFQTIYATLMAKIYEDFQVWVRPAILSGKSREEVDLIVSSKIISPIVADLEVCPDYDGVAILEVRGMVYFLTGNCHLRWH